VPPRDSDALAGRLALLLERPDLRRRMGQRSLDRVRRNFTWRAVAKLISNAYHEILSTPVGSTALGASPSVSESAVMQVPAIVARQA
jgi:hypothetical protein